MEVGINYPWMWNAYGSYFGGGAPIPGSNPAWKTWPNLIEKNLRYLKDLNIGIRVVRLFLMCNCWNFGEFETVNAVELFKPPSPFPQEFGEHLEEILKRFKNLQMLIIPVLIDFTALQERVGTGRYGPGGRFSIVRDRGIRKQFFDDVLKNFLERSLPYHESIYAWEIINEPVWSWDKSIVGHKGQPAVLDEPEVRDFLREAIGIIESKSLKNPNGNETGIQAFKATVGHRFSDDMLVPRGSLENSGMKPQYHYYGYSLPLKGFIGAGRDISPVIDYAQMPYQTFVGEFASKKPNPRTNPNSPFGQGMAWDELQGHDEDLNNPPQPDDTKVRVFERLKALHFHGYKLALVWPDLEGTGIDPSNDPLKLSQGALDGIREYYNWNGYPP